LAERGWEDLNRCKPSATARARAILFVEGMRDQYFRSRGVTSAPVPVDSPDFGPPERFVPQRRRVLARLKSLRGMAEMLLRLVDPRNWWRSLRPCRHRDGPVGASEW
jgi:hypothetical protein